jgi:hypothetical protein
MNYPDTVTSHILPSIFWGWNCLFDSNPITNLQVETEEALTHLLYKHQEKE